MAKGQKESVVEEILLQVPTFKKHVDNAILVLSSSQLENVKANIFNGIINGLIEYSKDPHNHAEVRSYARSMVMNHIKKAKELNGGHIYTTVNASNAVASGSSTTVRTVRQKLKLAPKGVNPDLLPEDLREYVKSLV